jgi:DNA polymerase-3 subunit alpha
MRGCGAYRQSLDDSLRVEPSSALMGDLKALLGPSCLAT